MGIKSRDVKIAKLLNKNFHDMSFTDKKKVLGLVISSEECDEMLVRFLGRYYNIDLLKAAQESISEEAENINEEEKESQEESEEKEVEEESEEEKEVEEQEESEEKEVEEESEEKEVEEEVVKVVKTDYTNYTVPMLKYILTQRGFTYISKKRRDWLLEKVIETDPKETKPEVKKVEKVEEVEGDEEESENEESETSEVVDSSEVSEEKENDDSDSENSDDSLESVVNSSSSESEESDSD